jgi:tetratricopeptide (TPR) repeat protein
VRLDPDLAEAHVGVGAVHSARYFRGGVGGEHSLATARENFEKALGLEPDLLAARRGLVHCLWLKGKSEDVLKQGSEAERRGRGDVDELVTRGEAYILGGLADKAIPPLRRALDLDPANEGALWFLVVACAWAGQYADCIQSGETFLTRFGEDPEVLTWLGAAHLCRDEFDAAESRYTRAVELFGEDSNLLVYFQLGNLYRRRGDAAKSREIWQRGLDECSRKLDAYPDNARIRCVLIGFLGLLGERKRVEEEVQRLPSQVGDMALSVVGYAEAMIGNPDRAVEWMRRDLQNGSYNITRETVFMCAYGLGDHLADTPGYKAFMQECTREGGRLRAIY